MGHREGNPNTTCICGDCCYVIGNCQGNSCWQSTISPSTTIVNIKTENHQSTFFFCCDRAAKYFSTNDSLLRDNNYFIDWQFDGLKQWPVTSLPLYRVYNHELNIIMMIECDDLSFCITRKCHWRGHNKRMSSRWWDLVCTTNNHYLSIGVIITFIICKKKKKKKNVDYEIMPIKWIADIFHAIPVNAAPYAIIHAN